MYEKLKISASNLCPYRKPWWVVPLPSYRISPPPPHHIPRWNRSSGGIPERLSRRSLSVSLSEKTADSKKRGELFHGGKAMSWLTSFAALVPQVLCQSTHFLTMNCLPWETTKHHEEWLPTKRKFGWLYITKHNSSDRLLGLLRPSWAFKAPVQDMLWFVAQRLQSCSR